MMLTSLRIVLVLRDATVVGEMPFFSMLSIPSKYVAMDFRISNLLSEPTCLIPRFLHSRLRWSRTRVFNSTTLSTWLIQTVTDCATSWSSPKCCLLFLFVSTSIARTKFFLSWSVTHASSGGKSFTFRRFGSGSAAILRHCSSSSGEGAASKHVQVVTDLCRRCKDCNWKNARRDVVQMAQIVNIQNSSLKDTLLELL